MPFTARPPVSSLHRLLSLSNFSVSSCLCLCLSLTQLHFAVLCDGAPEELGGYARAGPGLQRLSRHRLHSGEGELSAKKSAQLANKIHKRAVPSSCTSSCSRNEPRANNEASFHSLNATNTTQHGHTPTLNMRQILFSLSCI